MTSGVSPETGLAPLVLVADPDALAHLVAALALAPVVAVDTESNSLHAYRERVCLIQISTSDADYIVDPIGLPDLSALGPVMANPRQQKILHAAENDLVCPPPRLPILLRKHLRHDDGSAHARLATGGPRANP